MFKVMFYAVAQSILLVAGQVTLKFALLRMLPFAWNRDFWVSVFLNIPFACAGVLFASSSVLWMYIVKHFPLSSAYPMISLSYVFGILAAVLFFHENVSVQKWVGVMLIVIGCFVIAK
ncbi:MAG: EamA family transporter [Prevotellaceae bacterium]|nr:EamA family transporter [Prevotellaceae bacterium]